MRGLRYARRYTNWREMLRARAEGLRPPVVELRAGIRFESPPSVSVPRLVNEIFFRRVYTPWGHEIGAHDVVLDVGANVGVFSLYAATRSRGRIVAVEPFPANLEFLQRNLAANDQERVEVVPSALSDRVGSISLIVASKGTMHSIAGEQDAGGESIEVPTTTLAALVDKLGLDRIDFMKMDCEGAEGTILPAVPPELWRRFRRISMEFHDGASALRHQEIQKLLEEAGFPTRLRWDGRSGVGILYAARE